MSLSLYKIRTYTNKIDITAIGAKIKYITTKWQQLSCIKINFILVYSHLIFSYLDTPLLHYITDKFHRLVLEYFLGLLLVKFILVKNLLHQFRINVRPLSFYHFKDLSTQQLALNLVLGQTAFILYVIHHSSCRVKRWCYTYRLLHHKYQLNIIRLY
jgi:hypothetical protein